MPTDSLTATATSAIKSPVRALEAGASRILAIDALRGIALIVMALDHAAWFAGISLQAETYGGQPAMLDTPAHWISGLMTNIAAPTFWLLSGFSIALLVASRRKNGESEWAITKFLLIRAGVIILLDLTVCQFAWTGNGPYTHILLSIGLGLVVLSVARLLPVYLFAGLLFILLIGYQLYLPFAPVALMQTNDFWGALFFSYSTKTSPAVEYSLLGWPVLMGLGYVVGTQIHLPIMRRARFWVIVGAGLLLLWFGLRAIGKFGDLVPFTPGVEWYRFIILSKQPPTLTFFTFNLGIAMLLLALLHTRGDWLNRFPAQWLVVIGQVSLFFFVIHIVVYAAFSKLFGFIPLPIPGMVRAYSLWLVGLLVLFPLARAYRYLRKTHPQSVLRYL